MNEANKLVEKLKQYYKVGTLQELGEKIGVAQTTISGWKKRNSINAVKRKIYELDLDIDLDIDKSQIDSIDDEIEKIYSLDIDHAIYTAKVTVLLLFEKDSGTAINTYLTKDMLLNIIKDLASDKDKYTPDHIKKEFLARIKGLEVGFLKKKPQKQLSSFIEQYFSNIQVYALVHYPEIVFEYTGYWKKSKFEK